MNNTPRRTAIQAAACTTSAADEELGDILNMFDRAESKRDYPGSYFPAKIAAEKAMKEWREKYPREAAMRDARKLRDQADHLRGLAFGVETFDADGWLSAADQQVKHDKWLAEAQEKIDQAATLEAAN